MKEILKNNVLSLNVGASHQDFAVSTGYNFLSNSNAELHLLITNGIKDTFKLQFNPGIGLGISLRL
jgi:hypothetical protein